MATSVSHIPSQKLDTYFPIEQLPQELKAQILAFSILENPNIIASLKIVSNSFKEVVENSAQSRYRFLQIEFLIKKIESQKVPIENDHLREKQVHFEQDQFLVDIYFFLGDLAVQTKCHDLAKSFCQKIEGLLERFGHPFLTYQFRFRVSLFELYLKAGFKKESETIYHQIMESALRDKNIFKKETFYFDELVTLAIKHRYYEDARKLLKKTDKEIRPIAAFNVIKIAADYGCISFAMEVLLDQDEEKFFYFLTSIRSIAKALDAEENLRKRGRAEKIKNALEELLPHFSKISGIHNRLDEFQNIVKIFAKYGLRNEILKIAKSFLLEEKVSSSLILKQIVTLFIQLDEMEIARNFLGSFPIPPNFSERGNSDLEITQSLTIPEFESNAEEDFEQTLSYSMSDLEEDPTENSTNNNQAFSDRDFSVYINTTSQYEYEKACLVYIEALVEKKRDLVFVQEIKDPSLLMQTYLLLAKNSFDSISQLYVYLNHARGYLSENPRTFEENRLVKFYFNTIYKISQKLAEKGNFKEALKILTGTDLDGVSYDAAQKKVVFITMEAASQKKLKELEVFFELSQQILERNKYLKLLSALFDFFQKKNQILNANFFKKKYLNQKSDDTRWDRILKLKFSVSEKNLLSEEEKVSFLKDIIFQEGKSSFSTDQALDLMFSLFHTDTIAHLESWIVEKRQQCMKTSFREKRPSLNIYWFNERVLEIASWLVNKKFIPEALKSLSGSCPLMPNNLATLKFFFTQFVESK